MKIVNILVCIKSAAEGLTRTEVVHDDGKYSSIILNMSEKDIDKIIHSSNKSIWKRDVILNTIYMALPLDYSDKDNILRLKGFIVSNSVMTPSQVHKVLSRAFVPTRERISWFDIRCVRVLFDNSSKSFDNFDQIILSLFHESGYCKKHHVYAEFAGQEECNMTTNFSTEVEAQTYIKKLNDRLMYSNDPEDIAYISIAEDQCIIRFHYPLPDGDNTSVGGDNNEAG